MRIRGFIGFCGVVAVAGLVQACLVRPWGADSGMPDLAAQCGVTVRNESVWPLEVEYTIASGAGSGRRSGSLGTLGSGRSKPVSAFCGETVTAHGRTVDGRVAQGSSVAHEAGPNEIVLRVVSD